MDFKTDAQARIRERMAQFQDPRDKILTVFDLLGETIPNPWAGNWCSSMTVPPWRRTPIADRDLDAPEAARARAEWLLSSVE